MPIEITCECGAAYRLDESRAGELFCCRVCSASIRLPTGQPRVLLGGTPAIAIAPVQAAAAATMEPVPARAWEPSETGSELSPADAPSPCAPAPFEPVLDAPAPLSAAAAPMAMPLAAPDVAQAPVPFAPATPKPRAAAAPRRLPRSWWAVRGGLLAMCGAMYLVPWFTTTFRPGMPRERLHANGWDLTVQLLEAALQIDPAPEDEATVSQVPRIWRAPRDAGTAAFGLAMVMAAPGLFLLGLLSAAPFACRANDHGGRGAHWPFLICLLSTTAFLTGWQLFSRFPAFRKELEAVARSTGMTVGPSAWVYVMWVALVVMAAVAAGRPDPGLPQQEHPAVDPEPAAEPA